MNMLLIPCWSKETLQIPAVQNIVKQNAIDIQKILQDFEKNNKNKNFYIAGSSALILQGYLAKDYIKDVDIYCEDKNIIITYKVDFIKNDIFPPGWRDRVIEINGYKVISAFDVTCTMACCYLKPKVSRQTILMWMLREFNLDDIKQAIQAKLDSGIGVTESDFKSVEAFNKEITQKVIDKNRNPQQQLIEELQKLEEGVENG